MTVHRADALCRELVWTFHTLAAFFSSGGCFDASEALRQTAADEPALNRRAGTTAA